MMHIKLIRGQSFNVRINAFEVLCKPALLEPFGHKVQSPSLPPSLHPRLMERLLGKSPLRLVLSRTEVEKHLWIEKLECGHERTEFSEFAPENNRYVWHPPTAKRRRCRLCKPEVAPVLKTKAEISADQARAALIHERKLKFGTMFAALCFENGEMRPGPTEEELLAQCKLHTPKTTMNVALGCAGIVDEEANAHGTSIPAPYDAPRKPVQSEKANRKTRLA